MKKQPKYKEGDLVRYRYIYSKDPNETFLLRIDTVQYNERADEYEYREEIGDGCWASLLESDVIGKAGEEECKEYQLYLKLKAKYG